MSGVSIFLAAVALASSALPKGRTAAVNQCRFRNGSTIPDDGRWWKVEMNGGAVMITISPTATKVFQIQSASRLLSGNLTLPTTYSVVDDDYDCPDVPIQNVKANGFSEHEKIEGLVLKEGYISVNQNSFKDCKSLKSIWLPKYFVQIGDSAFEGCTNLQSIHMCALSNIGETAFARCVSVTEVSFCGKTDPALDRSGSYRTGIFPEIESSVRVCYWYDRDSNLFLGLPVTFREVQGTSAYSQIKSSRMTVTKMKFSSTAMYAQLMRTTDVNQLCTECIYEMEITGTVDLLYTDAFASLKHLTTVAISSTLSEIWDGCFRDCVSLESITMPNTVEKIGPRAFSNTALSSISIPAKVKALSVGLLENSVWLTKVTVSPDLKTIGDYAFKSCGRLEQFVDGSSDVPGLNLPLELTAIGDGSFDGCSSLGGDAIVPEGVSKIGQSCFQSCGFSKVVLMGELEQLGGGAFMQCESLTYVQITLLRNQMNPATFANCTKLETLWYCGATDPGVTPGDPGPFHNCSLGSVYVPPSYPADAEFAGKSEVSRMTGGPCGAPEPESLSPTGQFSASHDLTRSSSFTATDGFLPTQSFMDSDQFSQSVTFTETQAFAQTSELSASEHFTATDMFTPTDDFMSTSDFGATSHFSQTSIFMQTDKFAATGFFTRTSDFNPTSRLTDSMEFTGTSEFVGTEPFGMTNGFTVSSSFAATSLFRWTDHFSQSSFFGETGRFTMSDVFTETLQFAASDYFSSTDSFTCRSSSDTSEEETISSSVKATQASSSDRHSTESSMRILDTSEEETISSSVKVTQASSSDRYSTESSMRILDTSWKQQTSQSASSLPKSQTASDESSTATTLSFIEATTAVTGSHVVPSEKSLATETESISSTLPHGGGVNVGLIIGIVFAVLILILIALILIYILLIRKRKDKSDTGEPEVEMGIETNIETSIDTTETTLQFGTEVGTTDNPLFPEDEIAALFSEAFEETPLHF